MSSKRELIEPHKGDKRYVRRDKKGEFKEVDDVGRSLAAIAARKQRLWSSRARATRATGLLRRGNYRLSASVDEASRVAFRCAQLSLLAVRIARARARIGLSGLSWFGGEMCDADHCHCEQ
jgi:hypothetical protein